MIVHVVIGGVGGGYDEWPDTVICGVFTDRAKAEAYVAAEEEKQTQHRRWKDVCHLEKERLRPTREAKRQMSADQVTEAKQNAKAKALELAGPEPECSPVSYYEPIVAIELDVWLRDGIG